ncbi:glycerol-3-phosphate dehydrogenase/oxidase [Terriglobus tenax]|uniref:glycerol-3-phosphate dehydrogenase/oxidase n=1 Tax=Terriglobus tenax TaxID=1111115 RepID=UPI0021E0685F|nr:FAD-dependent oxidoreductase [Terriglobus tenax]
MNDRAQALHRLQTEEFDLLILGGGATGLGIAVDAVTRGYRTALIDAGDFAHATSSRATKLVHGGVRYLASGQIHLVYEALHERAAMLHNAPHLVQPLPFVTPAYKWFDLPWYGAGLKLYDLLSGKATMGPTSILGKKKTVALLPNIAQKNLKGAVVYHDGQFDDARFALALARTAVDHGAVVLNYVRCVAFSKAHDKITSALVWDQETGEAITVRAKVFVNATGIFTDDLRHLDDPKEAPLLNVSRGTHIVVPPTVLGSGHAIMVPKTEDGRVIFAIPWLGKVVIGTTDLAAPKPETEPGHEADEIDYLLHHINPYLQHTITRADILSVFSGLRPLVTGAAAATSKLSREHHIEISPSGLLTIAGGKWTTYRRMAQDLVDFAIKHGALAAKECRTETLLLHGAPMKAGDPRDHMSRYGTARVAIETLIGNEPALGEKLDGALPFLRAEVVYAARAEMARTVEDVLSRRCRALILDAKAAVRSAPKVAEILATELGKDEAWQAGQVAAFTELAERFYLAESRG